MMPSSPQPCIYAREKARCGASSLVHASPAGLLHARNGDAEETCLPLPIISNERDPRDMKHLDSDPGPLDDLKFMPLAPDTRLPVFRWSASQPLRDHHQSRLWRRRGRR
ncbi:hypothetical protein RHIZ404_220426 [Rhizobium sp. EC-SD404]|nr:hypothetical protein RHIZ404_220426 [Rhizobium sp. EC-SD404]